MYVFDIKSEKPYSDQNHGNNDIILKLESKS